MGRPVSHGHAGRNGSTMSATYRSWVRMKVRCTNPNAEQYQNYGGRGITYDPAWEKFENFIADMGERPVGLTLDRIDNDGPYSKTNCKWSSGMEQSRNRRTNRLVTLNGTTKSLAEWCEELNLPYNRVHARLTQHGWTPEEALS